jgi:hypothetical protein
MRTTRPSRPSIPPRSTFTGFRFPSDVIVLAVRWYLRFGPSYRDVEELLIERGVQVDHVTLGAGKSTVGSAASSPREALTPMIGGWRYDCSI